MVECVDSPKHELKSVVLPSDTAKAEHYTSLVHIDDGCVDQDASILPLEKFDEHSACSKEMKGHFKWLKTTSSVSVQCSRSSHDCTMTFHPFESLFRFPSSAFSSCAAAGSIGNRPSGPAHLKASRNYLLLSPVHISWPSRGRG
jgi:hypothetical protein